MTPEAEQNAMLERLIRKHIPNSCQPKVLDTLYWDEVLPALRELLQAVQERDARTCEYTAKQVGGKFWETHRLNTGLLQAIASIRAQSYADLFMEEK